MKKIIVIVGLMLAAVAWPVTAKAATVAVLDAPVYCAHKELTGHCRSYWQPQFGDSFLSHHGTAVASVIAGKTTGIAPGTNLVTFDLFYHPNNAWEGYWIGHLKDSNGMTMEESAVWYAKKRGATIVNQSYGTENGTIYGSAQRIWRMNRDVLFVKASGNEGLTIPATSIPSNVILVGATNSRGQLAPWSNRPGRAMMRHWIVANGHGLKTAGAFANQGYLIASGTSFAAPRVSGAAAILHNRYPHLRRNPGATKSVLLRSATDLGAPGVDPVYGWGMLNVSRAILTASADLYKAPTVVPEKDAPHHRVNIGDQRFSFQFVPDQYGNIDITSLRYNLTDDLSLGYLIDGDDFTPSVNYSNSGFNLTLAYDRYEDQNDIYYSPMMSASASYLKSFEIDANSSLNFTAEVPMFNVSGYSQFENERLSYSQDPDFKVSLTYNISF